MEAFLNEVMPLTSYMLQKDYSIVVYFYCEFLFDLYSLLHMSLIP